MPPHVKSLNVLNDSLAKMEAKGDKSLIGYDYTMRPILFVLPKQTPENVAARKKEAEALRAKFQGCEEGLALVRGLRDKVDLRVEDDAAGIGTAETRDAVEQRRLAGAVWPDDADDLPLWHRAGHARERMNAAKSLGDAVDRKQR